MHQDEAIQIYTKIFNQLGTKWPKFIEAVKHHAHPDDESQISYSKFGKLCEQFGSSITTKEKRYLLEAFPGMESGDQGEIINVARIYD